MKATTEEIDDLIAAAEAGRDAPMLSGPHLVLWGGLTSLASFAHWAIISGGLGVVDGRLTALIWLSMGAIGFFASRALGHHLGHQPATNALANIAAYRAFTAGGIAIWAFAFGVMARNSVLPAFTDLKADYALYDLIIPVGFVVFAAIFGTLAALARRKWLYTPAFGCGVSAFATLLVFGTSTLYLVASIGLFLTMVVPGLLLLRRHPPSLNEIDRDG